MTNQASKVAATAGRNRTGLLPIARRLVGPRLYIILISVLLLALPLFGTTHIVILVGSILIFAMLVLSVDLLTGLTGLATMGQTAFFGIGAYTAGVTAIHLKATVWVQLAAGVTVASVAALVVGSLAIRSSGTVFLMVTVAIAQITYTFFDGWRFVGASDGLAGVPPPKFLPGGSGVLLAGVVYWWILAVFAGSLAVAILVSRSPLGRSMRAVRESETRLRAIGQNPYWTKLAAFVVAGAVAGAAGTAFVAQRLFISPGDFSFQLSILALLSVAIGGAGKLWGPMIAAAVVVLVRDEIGVQFDGRGVLILGIVFVASVYVLPHGIAGIRDRRASQ